MEQTCRRTVGAMWHTGPTAHTASYLGTQSRIASTINLTCSLVFAVKLPGEKRVLEMARERMRNWGFIHTEIA
eukprot:767482-Hanusia_phi.AAC.3